MDERERLRRSLARFGSEMERVLGTPFVDLTASLERLLDALECEPAVSAYLDDCTAKHLPQGFDATLELARVAGDATATFGPFPKDAQAASAEAYLILKELVRQRVRFHDPLFAGYAPEPATPGARIAAFREDVVLRLTGNVEAHLAELARELDVQAPGVPAHEAQAPAAAAAPAAFSEERLEGLLVAVSDAAAELPPEDRQDAALQLEALRDELSGSNPKRSVVRVLLRVLGAIGGDVRFESALAQLAACLQAGGLA